MQAHKAFDSPRRANRGAVADLQDRLNQSWPKGRTALPPKREIIFTPLNATYKGRLRICATLGLGDFAPHTAHWAVGPCQTAVNQAIAITALSFPVQVEIEVEAGKTYYVKYAAPTFTSSTMAPVEAAIGEKEIRGLEGETFYMPDLKTGTTQ